MPLPRLLFVTMLANVADRNKQASDGHCARHMEFVIGPRVA